MPFVLTIAEGRGAGQKFQFDTDNVTIGRGVENDVVLNDAGVSRLHARIERQGAAWMLLDNGSANGTELNGSVIGKPSQLRAGDRIGVGPVTFEFFSQSEETRITSPAPQKETRISKMPSAPKAIEPRAGSAQQAWGQLPLWARIAFAGGAALILIGVARLAVSSKAAKGLACPDTVAVDDDTAAFSFGHSEVDVECGAKVAFGFNVPPQTRVLFHYQPMHISTPSELELRVNGKHLAWAPVAGARGEAQVVTIPQETLSADGRNFVVFTQSQRDKEWAIGKVRAEMLAITPGDLVAAKQAYDRGRRKLEERRIAPRNLYDAWKAFTEARRQMEGLAQKPALYAEVAQLIKDSERDLDRECSKLLFTAQRFNRYAQDEKAQQTYREVLLHFPGEDPTGCRKKAQENIVSAQAAAASE